MKGIYYSVKLRGLKSPAGTISALALMELIDIIREGAERSLRLSIEGASVKKGKPPAWLTNSLDFVITGISKGSTVIEMEAPTLEETAAEQLQQQDLWFAMPRKEDTALSVFARAVQDATAEKLDSLNYDRGILSTILSFSLPLNKYMDELELTSATKGEDKFVIRKKEIEKVGRIEYGIPEPRVVMVSGTFNLIEHAETRFQLALKEGRKIFGKAEPHLISRETMRELWGKKVTIKGLAHFSAQGKMRFIEAQLIKAQETGEEIFEDVIEPIPLFTLLNEAKAVLSTKGPLKSIWGQWPGDESIEELLTALK